MSIGGALSRWTHWRAQLSFPVGHTGVLSELSMAILAMSEPWCRMGMLPRHMQVQLQGADVPFLTNAFSGAQVFPPVNPRILEQLRTVDAIVYGVGSLYTSICPSLVSHTFPCPAPCWPPGSCPGVSCSTLVS